MNNLNRYTINIRGLNVRGLNGVDPFALGGSVKPWQAYVQDGLIFQLDCKKKPVGTEWHDCVAKSDKYATLPSFTIADDGAVVTSSVNLPKLLGAMYYEVCKKNADGEVVTETSTTSPTISGTIYAVRVYSAPVSGNAAIDQRRFGAGPVVFDNSFDITFE